MRKKQTTVNSLWTSAAITMTGVSLILTGCSNQPAAKAEGGEMGEPMAPPPQQAVDYSDTIASLQERLANEKLDAKQERDLRKLISGLKESAASHSRHEKRP